DLGQRIRDLPLRSAALVLASSGKRDPGFLGHSVSHAVQPTHEGLVSPERNGLLAEYEKRGLKRVFGVVLILEDSPGKAPHHWAVAPQHCSNRGLIAFVDEALQQLAIR